MRRATKVIIKMSMISKFQSTLSVRRATDDFYSKAKALPISIHALREESDVVYGVSLVPLNVFQSTLSVRRATDIAFVVTHLLIVPFQSTLSVRRATSCCSIILSFNFISIHALREESDL